MAGDNVVIGREPTIKCHPIHDARTSGDSPKDHPAALSLLSKVGWQGDSGFAAAESLDLLDSIQRSLLSHKQQMPVPTSFLVDASGRLAVIYKGAVNVEQLLSDISLCGASNDEIWATAVPFPGRWFEKPRAAAHARMAIETQFIKTAAQRIRQTLKLDPAYPLARLRLAQALLQSKPVVKETFREAIQVANQSATSEPATADAAKVLIEQAEQLLGQLGQ